MRPCNLYVLTFRLVKRAFNHLMRNGAGKQHKQIRISEIFKPARHFRIYFGLAFIFAAQILIPSDHTFTYN